MKNKLLLVSALMLAQSTQVVSISISTDDIPAIKKGLESLLALGMSQGINKIPPATAKSLIPTTTKATISFAKNNSNGYIKLGFGAVGGLIGATGYMVPNQNISLNSESLLRSSGLLALEAVTDICSEDPASTAASATAMAIDNIITSPVAIDGLKQLHFSDVQAKLSLASVKGIGGYLLYHYAKDLSTDEHTQNFLRQTGRGVLIKSCFDGFIAGGKGLVHLNAQQARENTHNRYDPRR